MNSSLTEFKRHEAVGLGRTPHPFENVDIIVDVIGHDDYVIDFNTWDIVESDKITVKFLFDDSWNRHTDKKCIDSLLDTYSAYEARISALEAIVRHANI